MITISVCMIVKNEHDSLGRCLESLKDIADEIIIVDTGSTDDTKEIAARYTDKIYDFEWTGSFSDARNYSFSLASCDYIYQADADEELDKENIRKFLDMKQVLLPEIDIVQMYYCNQLENNTIYNFDRELRPKLYKRLRKWEWQETIHEAVRLDPVIYDSEIDIIHRPGEGHARRDLAAFERLVEKNEGLSNRLIEIYAKELYIAGEDENFLKAKDYFCMLSDSEIDEKLVTAVFAISAKASKIAGDIAGFHKYALRAAAGNMMCSELCCELGAYYKDVGDINEARLWYYNALHETEPAMNIKYGSEIPEDALTVLDDMV